MRDPRFCIFNTITNNLSSILTTRTPLLILYADAKVDCQALLTVHSPHASEWSTVCDEDFVNVK